MNQLTATLPSATLEQYADAIQACAQRPHNPVLSALMTPLFRAALASMSIHNVAVIDMATRPAVVLPHTPPAHDRQD